MVNYFSIGIDARIGLGFDKNRSKNVYMNRFIYFLEGLKKLFLKTEKINNLVKELRIVEEVDIHKTSKKVLFKTKSNDCNKDDTVLISDTGSLLCLNINRYINIRF
jgi:diacylglycerol kinase (ATP)